VQLAIDRDRAARRQRDALRPDRLFTIGIVRETNTSLFKGQNTALSVQIFNNATSPFSAQQDRAWGAALTLIIIVFVFTILARLVTAFFSRRQTA